MSDSEYSLLHETMKSINMRVGARVQHYNNLNLLTETTSKKKSEQINEALDYALNTTRNLEHETFRKEQAALTGDLKTLIGNTCQAVMHAKPMTCKNGLWNSLFRKDANTCDVDCKCTTEDLSYSCCGGVLLATKKEAVSYYRCSKPKPRPRVVPRALVNTYI